MPTRKSPRKGSLQFWPRKRAAKFLPRVNWSSIDTNKILKGFICYKAGMKSAAVKDNTPDSMTKDKQITIPVTILECPPMKIMSVRFYKDSKVAYEVLVEGLDKELKKKIKIPKTFKKLDDIKLENYDDIKIICYSVVKKTGLKKKPDVVEIGLKGSIDEQMNFVRENYSKELSAMDTFENGQLVDLRGLTRGRGFCGPVKRFGITLKSHKSEKGRRRPGSLGPWHPARVIFRVPMAGQLGMFTRCVYNSKIIDIGKDEGKFKNIKKYGDIKTEYVVLKGSVQGPSKRQLVMTAPLRETRKTKKQSFELVGLR